MLALRGSSRSARSRTVAAWAKWRWVSRSWPRWSSSYAVSRSSGARSGSSSCCSLTPECWHGTPIGSAGSLVQPGKDDRRPGRKRSGAGETRLEPRNEERPLHVDRGGRREPRRSTGKVDVDQHGSDDGDDRRVVAEWIDGSPDQGRDVGV